MKKHVKKFLDNVFNEVFEAGHVIALINYSGSYLHGTNHDKSDYDFLGIYYPSLESIINKEDKNELVFKTSNKVNNEFDIDLKLISIYDYFNRLEKGDLNSIDFLFSLKNISNTIYTNNDFLRDYLLDNRKDLFIPNYYAMIGYAIKQVSTYTEKGIKFNELEKIISYLELKPNKKTISSLFADSDLNLFISNLKNVKVVLKEEKHYLSVVDHLFDFNFKVEYILKEIIKIKEGYGNRVQKNKEGIDFKAYSHAIRSFIEVENLINFNELDFPFKGDNKYLLKDIKAGLIDINELNDIISRDHAFVNNYMKTNELAITNANKKIDKKHLKYILKKIYF